MRVHIAITFSLICSPAVADGSPETGISTVISSNIGPFSIGRPHTCASYYPAAALKARIQGTDLVEFMVTTDGGVRDIKIGKSSGNQDLDDAALSCVAHWHYKPATKDGSPIEMPWKANVVWNIMPPPAVQTALGCLWNRENTEAPKGLGQTSVSFHVLQDGAVTDVKVRQSSGSTVWDSIGVSCTKARHYDVSIFTVPADGLSAHLEMDWTGAIASLAPVPAPAKK